MSELDPSLESSSGGITPAIADPFASIKDKYNNSIDELAKAYQSMHSDKDKLVNKYRMPEKYQVGEDIKALGDEQVNSLIDVAKRGEYNQSQFDALVNHVNEFQSQAADQMKSQLESMAEKRKEALGQDEGKLRSFYATKIPDELLNLALTDGTPEQISLLKSFRDKNLGGKITPPPGDTMSEPTVDKQSSIREKRAEMVKLSGEIPRATIEDQQVLIDKRNRLAQEVAQLNQQA